MNLWKRIKKRRKIKDHRVHSDTVARNDLVTVKIPPRIIHTIITASAQHLGTRDYQQDSLFVSESISLAKGAKVPTVGVLCDGMGGLVDGAKTSRRVVNTIAKALQELKGHAEVASYLKQQVIELDKMIAKETDANASTGTTLVAAYIVENQLYWCSVGDSRIYLLHNKEITCITRDHNYHLLLKEMVKRGEISNGEANSHPKRDALISFIGSGNTEIIDVNPNPIYLSHGDVVLLCSDGLTKSLTDQEIMETVYANIGDVARAAESLPLMAYDKNNLGKDNTSVILIQYLE